MADGLALLVAPLWIVEQVRQALSTSPSLTKWSGVSLVAGLILLLQASALTYQGVMDGHGGRHGGRRGDFFFCRMTRRAIPCCSGV